MIATNISGLLDDLFGPSGPADIGPDPDANPPFVPQGPELPKRGPDGGIVHVVPARPAFPPAADEMAPEMKIALGLAGVTVVGALVFLVVRK